MGPEAWKGMKMVQLRGYDSHAAVIVWLNKVAALFEQY
jgi:hypothetical protein